MRLRPFGSTGVRGFEDPALERVGSGHRTDACEKSLKRLGTDYLDCYLVHWRGRFALAETFRAFERLYHLRQRAIQHAVIPWCADRGAAVVVQSARLGRFAEGYGGARPDRRRSPCGGPS